MVGHAVQVGTDHAEVHDADLALDIPRAQAHLVQVAREVLATLLQGDIGARPPVPKRVLIDHLERNCGLHRPRLPREEDDVALRDSAPELVIKTVENVRIRSPWPIARHSIGRSAYDRPRPLSPGTSRRRMEENKKERGSKRELEDDRAPSIR